MFKGWFDKNSKQKNKQGGKGNININVGGNFVNSGNIAGGNIVNRDNVTKPVEKQPQEELESQMKQHVSQNQEIDRNDALAYENFDILIREEKDGSHTISASHQFQGGAQSIPLNFEFDPDQEGFDHQFRYLKELVADKEDIMALGSKIYDVLFPPEVERLFVTLREQMRLNGRGVRIRIDIRSAANKQGSFSPLIHLPWEYCYDDTNNSFLGKQILTPVVRYIPQDYTPDPLAVISKLRILVVLASPINLPLLDVNGEERIIRQALNDQIGKRVELEVLTHVTYRRLHQAISRFDPHVIHFVGHGSYANEDGVLLIETEDRMASPLLAEQFASLVKDRAAKVIVLNACETAAVSAGANAFNSVAAGLVYARIPAVIAMQFKVPDQLAVLFAETLYWQIAQGAPLDKAVSEMRLAFSLGASDQHQVLWGIPALYMRAADGRLFTPIERPHQNERPVHLYNRNQLYLGLNKYFNLRELKFLCFSLDVDYDSIGGDTKPLKVQELITYFERNRDIHELIEACRQQRPHADFG